jgi:hypothetical protein
MFKAPFVIRKDHYYFDKSNTKVTLLSFLCPSKNDMTFKITIEFVIDHY